MVGERPLATTRAKFCRIIRIGEYIADASGGFFNGRGVENGRRFAKENRDRRRVEPRHQPCAKRQGLVANAAECWHDKLIDDDIGLQVGRPKLTSIERCNPGNTRR